MWPVLEAGIMGWNIRFIPHVKFLFLLPCYPQCLFPMNFSTWVNSGHFKRMEVSSVGTSPSPWMCAPSICLSPALSQTIFPVGFIILFSSIPSYTATVSPRGQMAFFVIFTLHPQRGVRAITQSPSPLQR